MPGVANETVEQQELMGLRSRSWCEGGNSKREDHDMPLDPTAWEISGGEATVESDPIDVANVVPARASVVTQAPRRRSISFRSIGGGFGCLLAITMPCGAARSGQKNRESSQLEPRGGSHPARLLMRIV